MPGKETKVSRRALLRTGALSGVIGVGIVMTGGTGASALSTRSYKVTSHAPAGDKDGSGAIVLYLPDPRSGEFDIFSGTTKTHRTDRSLARLVSSLAPRS